jgi:hypothetical protein
MVAIAASISSFERPFHPRASHFFQMRSSTVKASSFDASAGASRIEITCTRPAGTALFVRFEGAVGLERPSDDDLGMRHITLPWGWVRFCSAESDATDYAQ